MRSFSSSYHDFTITFKSESYLENEFANKVCKTAAFYIHSPFEMPLNVPYKKFRRFSYGTFNQVLIKPTVIHSDKNIRDMDLRYRKCYFEGEYTLKYFKRYTKALCDLEVLSELTFEKCGCVPFNYIRNQTMDVCDLSKWPCALELKSVVFDGKSNTKFSRHCLPMCDLVSYEYEVITTKADDKYGNE